MPCFLIKKNLECNSVNYFFRCVRTCPCKPPTAVGASQGRVALVARRNERNPLILKKRVFSFWFFFSFARKEEKKNIDSECNYY